MAFLVGVVAHSLKIYAHHCLDVGMPAGELRNKLRRACEDTIQEATRERAKRIKGLTT